MRLGVAIEETWDFFHEIYADFEAHHQTMNPTPQAIG